MTGERLYENDRVALSLLDKPYLGTVVKVVREDPLSHMQLLAVEVDGIEKRMGTTHIRLNTNLIKIG